MTSTRTTVVLAAAAIAAAAWIDPLYFPLVLLGPLLSGLVAGARGVGWRPVVAAWALAGLLMLATDLVINGEDVAFHAVVTVVMAALARAGVAAGGLARQSRSISRATGSPTTLR